MVKTSTVKKLRKKYERTVFKNYIYNTNPPINRHLYENKELNKDIIIKKDRKKTAEININKKAKNQNIDNNYNYTVKHNINISTKKFSELEDSLSQLSNNINKNLLDNFNNCGNFKNNEFLMRYRYQNNQNNNNNNNINDNQNMNYIEKLNKYESHLSTPAELLDFISNKSDNNLNNGENNTNNNINNNIN